MIYRNKGKVILKPKKIRSQPKYIYSLKMEELDFLFACGHTNPVGPTLQAFFTGKNIKDEIVEFRMHPAQPDLFLAGKLKEIKNIQFVYLDDNNVHNIPTLFFAGQKLNNLQDLISGFVDNCRPESVFLMYNLMKKYRLNVFERVNASINGEVDLKSSLKKTSLKKSEKIEFTNMLLSHETVLDELKGFQTAWMGSVKHYFKDTLIMQNHEIKKILEYLINNSTLVL